MPLVCESNLRTDFIERELDCTNKSAGRSKGLLLYCREARVYARYRACVPHKLFHLS